MRVFVMSLIILVNYILQSTLFTYIAIMSIKPNTALCIVICYAILRGDVEGAVCGFFAGLLQDLFFGGFSALTFALLGYFAGKPFKDFFRENYFMPIFLTSVAVFINSNVFCLFNFLLRAKLDYLYYFAKVIIPEVVYTALVSAVIYKLLYFANSKIEQREKRKNSLFDGEEHG